MSDYKLHPDGVIRTSDGAYIPANAANADWREYQDWLTKSNVPEPADSVPEPSYKRFNIEALTDTETAALKAMLVQNGVITEERAAEL